MVFKFACGFVCVFACLCLCVVFEFCVYWVVCFVHVASETGNEKTVLTNCWHFGSSWFAWLLVLRIYASQLYSGCLVWSMWFGWLFV